MEAPLFNLPMAMATLTFFFSISGMHSITFTFINNCPFTIWPATLTGATSPPFPTTGFILPAGATSAPINTVPAKWSGRIWARTQCSSTGRFTCLTGDCGSGQVPCSGAGGTPPVTLIEMTLSGANGLDFYDVSLVDGFNLPVTVAPQARGCPTTGCGVDINNRACPDEFAIRAPGGRGVIACKSACLAYGTPEYCCTGDHSTPATCPPTRYSLIFKKQCPQAYTYAFDDATSTFTCPAGGNYVIKFCP